MSTPASTTIEQVSLPTYAVRPRTALPPLFDPESLYPYGGFLSTEPQPRNRLYSAVVIENDMLRVTVLPELGGRILQIEDVRTGGRYIHANDVVRPVRIPYRWAYVSLGIELNFLLTHSPTGNDPVGYELLSGPDGSVGVAVGEKEMRWGLCWRAEIKLYPGFRGLCVAVRCWNPTRVARDTQWWSNAAQPAGGDTEFVYPDEPVIAHISGEKAGHWPIIDGRDLRWHRNYNQMCGLFWEPTAQDWFGAYHHERGWGLLHLSDPRELPGKKLWSFGHTGDTADWSLTMTRGAGRTCEIQSGIPTVQRAYHALAPGGELSFVEFWVPVDARRELDAPNRPSFSSAAARLGGVDALRARKREIASPSGGFWKNLMSAHAASDEKWIAQNVGGLAAVWPPTGLDLEESLQWAARVGDAEWRYQLGLWHCATGQWSAGRDALCAVVRDKPQFMPARAMLGLMLWKAIGRPEEAWSHISLAVEELRDGGLYVFANALLRQLGRMEERVRLLGMWPEEDFRKRETAAEIAIDSGDPEEAIRILTCEPWEKHHGRHRRGELWVAARRMLRLPERPVPTIFGEDPVVAEEGFR